MYYTFLHIYQVQLFTGNPVIARLRDILVDHSQIYSILYGVKLNYINVLKATFMGNSRRISLEVCNKSLLIVLQSSK